MKFIRSSALCFLVLETLAIGPAHADPKDEARNAWSSADSVCQEAISYKSVNIDMFQRYVDNRQKALSADPTIAEWTGKVHGNVVATRMKECDALFNDALEKLKAAAKAEENAANQRSANEAATYIPVVAERRLKECIEKPRSLDFQIAQFENDIVEFRRERDGWLAKFPALSQKTVSISVDGKPVNASFAEHIKRCESLLVKAVDQAKTYQAKQNADEKKRDAARHAKLLADFNSDLAKVKGARRRLMQYYGAGPSDTSAGKFETAAVWIYNMNRDGCIHEYHFSGDSIKSSSARGLGCNHTAYSLQH